MIYTYTAIFEFDDDKIGVTVPDLSGCFTFGDSMSDAIEMAEDVVAMVLAKMEDNKEQIPKPITTIYSLDKRNKAVIALTVDTDKWRKQHSSEVY